MSVFRALLKVESPHACLCSDTRYEEFANYDFGMDRRHLLIEEFDCLRMKSKRKLFKEFESKLRFPYFGHNWDALEDILGELEWMPLTAVIFVFRNPEHLLVHEKERELSIFLDILEGVGQEWAAPHHNPIDENDPLGKPRSFHSIIFGSDEQLRSLKDSSSQLVGTIGFQPEG